MLKNRKCRMFVMSLTLVFIFLCISEILLRIIPIGPNGPLFVLSADQNGISRWKTSAWSKRAGFDESYFSVQKTPKTIRVFLMGGSAAYGIPWAPNGTPARWLQFLLSKSNSNLRFEVINLALPGADMQYMEKLTMELGKYRPDALVIYAGDNEFLPIKIHRLERSGYDLSSILGRCQVVGLIKHFIGLFKFFLFLRQNSWMGNETQWFKENKLISQDIITKETLRCRQNLLDIAQWAHNNGVKVILSTVPTNLRDWAPNASAPSWIISDAERNNILSRLEEGKRFLESDPSSAEAILQTLAKHTPGVAEIHFWIGKAAWQQGRYNEAKENFILARDLDDEPTRAISKINDLIRELARDDNISLADVEKAFEENTQGTIPGYDLFDDYCHPNLVGQYILSLVLRDSISKGFPEDFQDNHSINFNRAEFEEGLKSLAVTSEYQVGKTFYIGLSLGLRSHRPRWERAIKAIKAASEMLPGYKYMRASAGLFALAEGNQAEAESCFREAFSEGEQRVSTFARSYFPTNLIWSSPYFFADASKLESIAILNIRMAGKTKSVLPKVNTPDYKKVKWGDKTRLYILSPKDGKFHDITDQVKNDLVDVQSIPKADK